MSDQQTRQRFPELAVASLGPIREGKPNGVVTADDFLDENQETHPEHVDQDQGPREGAKSADVTLAPAGCQVLKGEDVFVNTVGTVGVASPLYEWSRIEAALGRLAQYSVGNTASA